MTTRSIACFLVLNAGGIAAFLMVASQFWVEPELANVPGASVGDAFGWAFFAVPIAMFCVFADVLWTVVNVARAGWVDRVRCVSLSIAVLALWSVAYVFDNAHHGM